jgi:hypothetical protein
VISLAACGFLAAFIPGCGPDKPPPQGEPTFYASIAKGGKLDLLAAQSMISGYRRNNGLNPVKTDPGLTRIAEEHARVMAQRGQVEHNFAGAKNFNERIRSSGFDAKFAVENVGGGYHTLAEAFSGWRDSPSHRANMLRSGATHMGIAAVHTPNSKYKVFWVLVLAAQDDEPRREGPVAASPAEKPARGKPSQAKPSKPQKPQPGETTLTIQ